MNRMEPKINDAMVGGVILIAVLHRYARALGAVAVVATAATPGDDDAGACAVVRRQRRQHVTLTMDRLSIALSLARSIDRSISLFSGISRSTFVDPPLFPQTT